MPKIMMIKTMAGSEDGIRVREYSEGTVYQVRESLSDVFIQMGAAVLYQDPPPPPAPERKEGRKEDTGAVKENKDAGPSPENKTKVYRRRK